MEKLREICSTIKQGVNKKSAITAGLVTSAFTAAGGVMGNNMATEGLMFHNLTGIDLSNPEATIIGLGAGAVLGLGYSACKAYKAGDEKSAN